MYGGRETETERFSEFDFVLKTASFENVRAHALWLCVCVSSNKIPLRRLKFASQTVLVKNSSKFLN